MSDEAQAPVSAEAVPLASSPDAGLPAASAASSAGKSAPMEDRYRALVDPHGAGAATPAAAPPAVEKMSREQVDAEMRGIETQMRDNRSAYNKNDAMQARYRELAAEPSEEQVADHITLLEEYVKSVPLGARNAFSDFERKMDVLTGPKLGLTIAYIENVMSTQRARYNKDPAMQSMLRVLYKARDGK